MALMSLRRLAKDNRGVAAVEFAFIAPLLIALYLGLTEFCQAFMAEKRMGHVAAMTADLISQEETVTKAKLDDVFTVGGLIMKPFSTTPLTLRVSSVTRGADGVSRVTWSYAKGMSKRAVNSTVTVPANLIDNGESVIMSEAQYDYDSPVDYVLPAITTFKHTYFLRPRTVDQTACSNC